MARSSLGELFFKLVADTKDLASAEKAVDKFSENTKKSADEINKAAANVESLSKKEQAAADEAKQLHENAKKVVEAHKKAAKEAATLAEAEKIAADEAGNIKKSFEGLGPLIAGAVAGLSVSALVGGVKQLAEEAKTLENSAKSLGIGVEKLSEYQYAFAQVNIDGQKTVDMFKDIADRVGEFANSGGGELTDILARTNLEINELINLSPDQQLLKIYSALEDIDGITQAEITDYMEKLVSDATLLQPLLADGAAELRNFAEEGRALGVTLDQLEVDRLVEVDAEIRQLTSTWDGLTNDLMIAFTPALNEVFGGLSLVAQGFVDAKSESDKLEKSNSVNQISFENLDKAVDNTKIELQNYNKVGASGRAEIKKGIDARIAESKSYLLVQNAALKAAVAKDIESRSSSFQFFTNANNEAKKYQAAVKIISGNIDEEITNLNALRKLRDGLSDTNYVPPKLTDRRTFAQKNAAKEAAKKAADEKAAQDKRDKDTASREAQRAAAKAASDAKRKANEIKRAEEKQARQQARDAKELEREQEKLQRLADAQTKATTSALERVQSELLTKQEKENQSYAKSLADLKAAEEAKIATLIPYHELRQRLETEHQEALAEIKKAGENPEEQAAIDSVVGGLTGFELEEENTQYQADLEALAVARELKLETIASYDEIERAIEIAHQNELIKIKENADKRALNNQIKNYRLQTKGHQAALGGMLDLLRASGAEQSKLYKAMFAASKAFAIAESIIKIQQGIAQAASQPFPLNLAAIGTVLSATAGIVSTIRGAQFEGRQYGGSTAPNTGYQVNETGVPEIYSQGGRDYLLTGSERGKVTPLKAADKSNSSAAIGGTLRVTVNVDGEQYSQTLTPRDVEEIALDVVTRKAGEVVAQDFNNANSKASQGLNDNFKVTRAL